MACFCISGYCNNQECSTFVAACSNSWAFSDMTAGDVILSAHVDEFQDSIDDDNINRRGLAAVGWTYIPPLRDVGTLVRAAVYNEIAAYLNGTWGKAIPATIVNVNDLIVFQTMDEIKSYINEGRNECLCNTFCSCNINCSCNTNCGCNYV